MKFYEELRTKQQEKEFLDKKDEQDELRRYRNKKAHQSPPTHYNDKTFPTANTTIPSIIKKRKFTMKSTEDESEKSQKIVKKTEISNLGKEISSKSQKSNIQSSTLLGYSSSEED